MSEAERHDSIEQIRLDREFKLRVLEPGFVARETVPVGMLYDPQFVYGREPDGCILMGDVGGHFGSYSPDRPHGQFLKLNPLDDTLSFVMRPENAPAAPICSIRAPGCFGPWGGHVFTASQEFPGRRGAHNRHFVYKLAPGGDRSELFCKYPVHGPLNNGTPGAGVGGGFGPAGTQWEGIMWMNSLMNCTIYRVTPEAEITPFLCLEPSVTEAGPIMPIDIQVAPSWARDYAGELIVQGKPGQTYADEHDHAKHPFQFLHYHVDRKGRFDPKPIDIFAPIESQPAPSEFGPLAGNLFYVDEGKVDLFHTSKHDQRLPYTAKVMRVDASGKHHVFADNFQGASTVIIFENRKMYLSLFGKSYSTGDYHEPDGTIYEIEYRG